MNLPFSTEDFLQVFESYNLAVFPLQIVFNLLAVVMIFLAFWKTKYSGRIISFSLSFFWLWIGVVYQILFFSKINPAAKIFAVIFIIQGLLFLIMGVIKRNLNFTYKKDLRSITGAVLMIYALIVYPLLGMLLGHAFPRNPTFGLPCPTTIFTFGMLLWSEEKLPVYAVILPFLWSVIGFSAAFKLGIVEDTGLLISGIIGLWMTVQLKRKELKTRIAG